MEPKLRPIICVQVNINAPAEKVWKLWTTPDDIVKWNHASDDWHTTRAANDLRRGGKFLSRMEARDGSTGFDFEGVYETIKANKLIEYFIVDGRKVRIDFSANKNTTKVVETFEAENVYSIEQQRSGWQAILNNFKEYAELNK
jgi:uncharacterized protein YndB with AHSA1/START domain